jgi:hypothetical protein
MYCTIKWIFLHPMRGGHWSKLANGRKGSRYGNYDAASGTIFKKFFLFEKPG